MGADGSNQRRLMETPTQDSEPAWSRDGTKIAFVRLVSNVDEIFVANANGTGVRRLTSSSFSEGNLSPIWLLNDVFVFYASKVTGNWEIWRIEAESGINRFQVTTNGGNKRNLVFTPSGSILFDWHISTGNATCTGCSPTDARCSTLRIVGTLSTRVPIHLPATNTSSSSGRSQARTLTRRSYTS